MSNIRFVDTKTKTVIPNEEVKQKLVNTDLAETSTINKVMVKITPTSAKLKQGDLQDYPNKANRVIKKDSNSRRHYYEFNKLWLDAQEWSNLLNVSVCTIHYRNRLNKPVVNTRKFNEVKAFNDYVTNNNLDIPKILYNLNSTKNTKVNTSSQVVNTQNKAVELDEKIKDNLVYESSLPNLRKNKFKEPIVKGKLILDHTELAELVSCLDELYDDVNEIKVRIKHLTKSILQLAKTGA